jgi:hypothetical protein
VGANRIVGFAPLLDEDLCLLEGIEDLAIEEFILELAIEALIVTVLPRARDFASGLNLNA